MSHRAYRTAIPGDAAEVIEGRHPDGTKQAASYFVAGERVGHREWYADGRLEGEYGVRGGLEHGPAYGFYPSGQLLVREVYRDGKLHGTSRQWSEDGGLLVEWQLVHGTGLDLWCDPATGTLAEEMFWASDGELGYKREWNADERTVWQEYFFCPGRGYHGVWREWSDRGKLLRSFPWFYVNDRKVTKRQYLQACETDPTLPPYRAEEDDPHRPLPAEYRAQRRRRVGSGGTAPATARTSRSSSRTPKRRRPGRGGR